MKNKKNLIANIIITMGVLCICIFGIYHSVNYPWNLLLSNWGIAEENQDLKVAAPLPNSALNKSIETVETTIDILPKEGDILEKRPQMNLSILGTINLPKIEITENIVEGSGHEMLYAVGHVKGSALPGQEGNCVLAAHRNYIWMRPFRYLDKMQIGDKAYLTDDNFTYTYEVYNIFDIKPDEVWVMQPQENQPKMLTLITCTPIIAMDHRLILQCKLIDTTEKVI